MLVLVLHSSWSVTGALAQTSHVLYEGECNLLNVSLVLFRKLSGLFYKIH